MPTRGRSLRSGHATLRMLVGLLAAATGAAVVGVHARAQGNPPALRNELAGASSPYLRAAATQPVHWQEWSDAVFEKAKALDRPILLDIGAIWCHWCHEMDRESYEDPTIAALINGAFVPVKVDRDQRPDIDRRYQSAVAELTQGGGGWPLTVVLTPDGHVYYGGTYLPPETLRPVLTQAAQGYRTDRARVVSTAQAMRRHAESVSARRAATLSGEFVRDVVEHIRRSFDASEGGFALTPKFPNSNAVALLLDRHDRTGDPRLLEMATRTLDRMASGGIRDQLSGRFHRYATDRRWRVPHFEVMLHTQAEVLDTYLDAYAITGHPRYREVAEALLAYVKGTLSNREGGFFASQDADATSADDGSHYTWSLAQMSAVLAKEELAVLTRYYDVRPRGEMADVPRSRDPSQNVLWVADTPEQIAMGLRMPLDDVRRLLDSGRRKLAEARRGRPAPRVDRSILSDWNGMMVSAFLKASRVLGDDDARQFALTTLDYVVTRGAHPTGVLHHSLLGNERLVPGLLDDQVMMARALLDAYETTGDPAQLARARQLMVWTIENLWDSRDGGFFDSPQRPGAAGLLAVPRKEALDTPATSGNAVAAQVLTRLYYVTQEPRFRDFARVTIETFAGRGRDEGTFVAGLGLAASAYLDYPTTAVVVGRAGDAAAAALHRAALSTHRAGAIVMRVTPERLTRDGLPAAVRPIVDAVTPDRWPLAFVCSATACSLPTAAPSEVADLVKHFGRAR